jgi:flavodoxin
MKALVVYDSLYGNTKIIAQAIADAIPGDVELLHVADVNVLTLGAYDLLIVGAPTHGGRASPSANEMLAKIQPPALKGLRVATFDTRLSTIFLRPFGYAAPRIAKSLKQKGGTLIVPAEGFFVTGGEGPLKEGEVERAAAWATAIAAELQEAPEKQTL